MKRRTATASARSFIRLCSLKRFPTRQEALEHVRAEAARSGITVREEPAVLELVPTRSGEAWRVELVREDEGGEKGVRV